MSLITARDTFNQIGAKRFLLEIPPWLVRRRYIFYAGFYAGSPAGVAAPAPPPFPFSLDPVIEGDLHQLVALLPNLYTLPQLRARLQQGHLVFMGRSEDTIVHIRWVFVGSVYLPYLSRRLVLAPAEGYVDEMYTVPAWRRKGVETAMAVEMPGALRARGIRRIIGAIAAWNRVPQRMAEVHGLRQVGSGGYWNILGYKKFFWDGSVRDYGDGNLSISGAPD